jgi:bleomycin hydrolase
MNRKRPYSNLLSYLLSNNNSVSNSDLNNDNSNNQNTDNNVYNILDTNVLKKFEKKFKSNNENIISRNAVVSVGSTFATTDSEESKKVNHIFLNSVKDKSTRATNQGMSGRCWIYAGLNMFRHNIIKALNIDNFEFSQTYLFFWDKLERANQYVHLFIDGVDIVDTDNLDGDDNDSLDNNEIDISGGDLNFDYYAETFLSDGGFWSMFCNLVDKYGVVPKNAMPETFQSGDSEDMNLIIKNILHGCVNRIYKLRRNRNGEIKRYKSESAKKRFRDKLLAIKDKTMQQVYNTLVKFLGEPPKSFTWSYINGEENTPAVLNGLTPHKFRDIVLNKVDLSNDFVVLCNIPNEKYPYYKKYEVRGMNNVAGGANHTMINVPLYELKKYARKSLVAGVPVWFAGDVTKGFHPYLSSLDTKLINSDSVFGKTERMTRSERVLFRNQVANHAMVLTGINVKNRGGVIGWQVENSWGYWEKDTPGLDGFLYMSDTWFNEYMTEIVVHKEFFSKSRNMLRALNSEPIKVDPWSVISQATMIKPLKMPHNYVKRFLKPKNN